eukprot:scaffold11604_cov48-Phaeocystis_antarctica.AAC.1
MPSGSGSGPPKPPLTRHRVSSSERVRCGAVRCRAHYLLLTAPTTYYLLHLARPVEAAAIRLRGSSNRLCSLVAPAEVRGRGQRGEACGMSEGQNGLAFGRGPWPRSKVQSSHPPLGVTPSARGPLMEEGGGRGLRERQGDVQVRRAVTCALECALQCGMCAAVWNECAAALQPGTP